MRFSPDSHPITPEQVEKRAHALCMRAAKVISDMKTIVCEGHTSVLNMNARCRPDAPDRNVALHLDQSSGMVLSIAGIDQETKRTDRQPALHVGLSISSRVSALMYDLGTGVSAEAASRLYSVLQGDVRVNAVQIANYAEAAQEIISGSLEVARAQPLVRRPGFFIQAYRDREIFNSQEPRGGRSRSERDTFPHYGFQPKSAPDRQIKQCADSNAVRMRILAIAERMLAHMS